MNPKTSLWRKAARTVSGLWGARSAPRWLAVLGAAAVAPALAAGGHSHPGHAEEVHRSAAASAHVHGVLPMTLVLEGDRLTLSVEEAPLDTFLGFERAPRSAAEKQAADKLLSAWRSGQGLVAPDPKGQCTFQSAEVEAPVLTQPAQTRSAGGDTHADLDASLVFACARAQALESVDLSGLMQRFPRIRRIELQGVAGAGQFRKVIQRGQRPVVDWRR